MGFAYSVQSSDSDTDGITIAANALTLNGGTIKRFGSTANAALSLGSHAISDSSGHKVDGSVESAPAVNGVLIYSPESGDTYELAEQITRSGDVRPSCGRDRHATARADHRLRYATSELLLR